LKWPNVEPKSKSAPNYARLKDGHILTERDPQMEKRMDFLYKNVVQHLFE
jgi:hypothetical protein